MLKLLYILLILLPFMAKSPVYANSSVAMDDTDNYSFTFSLDSFRERWRSLNLALSTNFYDLEFSDAQQIHSFGRRIISPISPQLYLEFWLSKDSDAIRGIFLRGKAPPKEDPLQQLRLRNAITMLVSLIDFTLDLDLFPYLLKPLTLRAEYSFTFYHHLLFVSFINFEQQFILIVRPHQQVNTILHHYTRFF